MNDKEFIILAKKFLKYSLEEIDFNYDDLTAKEKLFVSRLDFKLLTERIKENEQTKK